MKIKGNAALEDKELPLTGFERVYTAQPAAVIEINPINILNNVISKQCKSLNYLLMKTLRIITSI